MLKRKISHFVYGSFVKKIIDHKYLEEIQFRENYSYISNILRVGTTI